MDRERLSSRVEDYLEAILQLSETPQGARTGEIARLMDVQPSTVSTALKSLNEQGLVDYTPYDAVTLTPDGRRVAEEIAGRHVALRRFLMEVLGLDPEDAEPVACGMEHDATPLVAERMTLLADFFRQHPGMMAKWLVARQEARGNGLPGVESSLDELPQGVRALVLSIDVEGALRRRLVEMGVTPGVLITVERVAPLGDPIAVEVRGYRLSMRKAEAANIRVRWRPGLA
ncbi:MAG: DtxR family transcriptional regulator [Lentisphaerae bacterium]|jgi:DtxR family Mn-dependent transcriptional regulator|nr:DtxR family transcriptional regulator [Lentisphaerota bacterium]